MLTEESQYSDDHLLQQIAAGNTDALGKIIRRYQGQVLTLAYRSVQNWSDAEDIAQESFVRVFKSACRFQGQSVFKTWLYRIVINLCIDNQRSRKSNISLDTIAPSIEAKHNPDLLEIKEISQIVQNAIQNLPEHQKVALILHRYENLSHAEISAVTGWTKSAVESLLVRAYGNLREMLKNLKKM